MSLRAAHHWNSAGLALGLLITTRAHASDVALEVRDCPALSEGALREHVELELGTLELTSNSATLRVRCDGSGVAIELERPPGTPYPIQVHVDLRDTARGARERLVALAATELLAQAERGRKAEPAVPLAVSSPRPERARGSYDEPRQRARSSELFIAGSMALDGKPKTLLWGGSLGALLGLGRSWSLLLDTRFERGQKSLPLASVRWSVLSGFVGPMLRGQAGPLKLAGGLGLRAGWLALDATASVPDQGQSLTAPWAGLSAPVRVGARLAGGVTPFIGGEAGYVIVPVTGLVNDALPIIEQRGLWLSACLGVGVSL